MTSETLNFITKTGRIEESYGRRKFWIEMDTDIRMYERKMLGSGECKYSLPMYFLSEDDTIKVFYDFTGYLPMKEWFIRNTYSSDTARDKEKRITDVLNVLSRILECIKGMENYLITPDRITIHPDTVFIDSNSDQIVLAFYPEERPEALQERFIRLIYVLGDVVSSEEANQYLAKLEEFIRLKNPGLDGIIGYLGVSQREVNYIYWNTKNFRRLEEHETQQEPVPIKKAKEKPCFNIKTIWIQIILVAVMISVFLSNRLEFLSYFGLVIIFGALELLVLRKHLDKRKRMSI